MRIEEIYVMGAMGSSLISIPFGIAFMNTNDPRSQFLTTFTLMVVGFFILMFTFIKAAKFKGDQK